MTNERIWIPALLPRLTPAKRNFRYTLLLCIVNMGVGLYRYWDLVTSGEEVIEEALQTTVRSLASHEFHT